MRQVQVFTPTNADFFLSHQRKSARYAVCVQIKFRMNHIEAYLRLQRTCKFIFCHGTVVEFIQQA
jgi:hypothetical protein